MQLKIDLLDEKLIGRNLIRYLRDLYDRNPSYKFAE